MLIKVPPIIYLIITILSVTVIAKNIEDDKHDREIHQTNTTDNIELNLDKNDESDNLRHEEDDSGLEIDDLERKTKCDYGEEYSKCGDPCEATCTYDPIKDERPKSCGRNKCKRGCFCKSGYVRHESECIFKEDCSSKFIHLFQNRKT